jgi:hypothetical protein
LPHHSAVRVRTSSAVARNGGAAMAIAWCCSPSSAY